MAETETTAGAAPNNQLSKMPVVKFCPDDDADEDMDKEDELLEPYHAGRSSWNNRSQGEDSLPLELELVLLKSFPTMQDLHFELSCVNCWTANGLPEISCNEDHVICKSCFTQAVGVGVITCSAELEDTADTTCICNADLFGTDGRVRNTEYYKQFMKDFHKIIFSAKNKAPIVDICVFRNYGGCSKEFGNLTDYTQHVLLEHKLKVVGSTMTNLLMKYDRENCTGNDYTTVLPIIRAGFLLDDKSFLCFLTVQEFEDKTRLCFINGAGNPKTISVVISVSNIEGCSKDTYLMRFQMNVIDDVRMLSCIELTTDDGRWNVVDLENKLLDNKYCIKKNQGKYFGLSVTIT